MLKNKIVAITGAGSGIGQAAAVLCAEAGASILARDMNERGLEETLALVAAKGGTAQAVRVDVSQ